MKQLTVQEMETVVASGGNYLVDFYADWCGPCSAIAPMLEEISKEGSIKVIKIDVDVQEHSTLEKYNIRSVPTILAFKNGKSVDKTVGSQPKSRLLKMFD
jgi:thioredoxin 1